MKPHEHYEQAEMKLLESRNVSPEYAQYLVAVAQVHATLATVPTWAAVEDEETE